MLNCLYSMLDIMARDFEGPLKLKKSEPEDINGEPPVKKQRTSEDFFTFCKYILEYEKYEPTKQEEIDQNICSPECSERPVDSFSSESNSSFTSSRIAGKPGRSSDTDSDDDSWDLITCYCMKPFAGRPMIECTECLTWIHLSCAKIRRNNIPDDFICQQCREAKGTTRRSQRIRTDGRRLSS